MSDFLADSIHYKRKAFLLGLARRLGGEPLLFALASVFYRLKIEGAEHIPLEGACLLPFNHVSPMVDALLYLVIRRRRPDLYLFAKLLLREPIAGLLKAFALPGEDVRLLSVHKRRGLSVGELLRARQALLQGEAVALAPEGEMTWNGRLQYPLAPGAAWLALHTGAPLVPAVSLGGYDLQPLWQIEKTRLTGRIRIRVGQPFRLCDQPLERVSDEQLEAGSQRIWDELAALLAPGH